MKHMKLVKILLPALVLGSLLSGCSGPPENIIGLAAPAEAVNAYGVKKRDVYVMTTRAASDDPSLMYSGERSEGLGLARVTVTIPPDHQTGAIERSEKGPPDPRKSFTIIDPLIFSDAKQFQASVGAELAELPKPDQRILLFVHGYNTTMTAAILRTAQLANDMNFEGIPVVFSWASRGKTWNYVYDMNSALSARDRLIEGATLLAQSGPAEFDIMAHSMGNLLTVEAIRQAHLEGKYDASGRVKNIILASPDIDMDLFTTQLDDLPADRRQFWVMISENDRALSVSQRIAGGINRVGNADSQRLAELGVAVVDLSQIDDKTSLHHAKFADAPEVVQLIGRRLESQGSIATEDDSDLSLKRLATDLASAPIILLGQGPLLLNQ